jgi:hypothetical protein
VSDISVRADIRRVRFDGHVWRTEDGTLVATVGLGTSTLWFDSPDDARAVAAACTSAAEAMDRFTAGEETGDGR